MLDSLPEVLPNSLPQFSAGWLRNPSPAAAAQRCSASEKWVPSEEELGLAGRIIGEMSLVGEDGDLSAEQLVPERMANPSILNMNGFIAEKLAGAPNGKPECGTGSSQLPSRSSPKGSEPCPSAGVCRVA